MTLTLILIYPVKDEEELKENINDSEDKVSEQDEDSN